MKISIWGTGKYASEVVSLINRIPEMSIVYFLETEKSKDYYNGIEVINGENINFDDFDVLVIASTAYHDILSLIRNTVTVCDEKKIFVYPKDFEQLWSFFNTFFPFYSCMADDCFFLGRNTDTVIIRDMLLQHRVWSADMIDEFFALSSKYYGKDSNSRGAFLDIGANIGTTAIYVKKKKNANLQVVAFEITDENYELLRINCILNHVEDIRVEKLGLSNRQGVAGYRYNPRNPGGSSMLTDCQLDMSANQAQIMRLDDYLAARKITDIDYIWLDTEGAEAEIIDGAMKTLREHRIPLLQEFNPLSYQKRNTYDDYIRNMCEIYSGFIDMQEYEKCGLREHSIDELQSYYTEVLSVQQKKQADLFFY